MSPSSIPPSDRHEIYDGIEVSRRAVDRINFHLNIIESGEDVIDRIDDEIKNIVTEANEAGFVQKIKLNLALKRKLRERGKEFEWYDRRVQESTSKIREMATEFENICSVKR